MGWKRVYNFLGKDEKHGEIFTYFCLKNRCGKKSAIFSVQCILTETTKLPTLIVNITVWSKVILL